MRTMRNTIHPFPAIILLLLVISLACSLPTRERPTPTVVISTQAIPSPTPSPAPLPSALIETDPPPGSEIALDNPITLYFNQPMNRISVEAAIKGEPTLAGSFVWLSDSVVTFKPDAAWLPNTEVKITIEQNAQSKNGTSLYQPTQITYRTPGYLQAVQKLPAGGTTEVDPQSTIFVAFNQPVVPLGADPSGLPAGFFIEPTIAGSGTWINTSTYIFYPEITMAGGYEYFVQINPELKSTNGSPLETQDSWSFTTAFPRLLSLEPGEGITDAPLDAVIQLSFNQAMDPVSITNNLSISDMEGQTLSGQSSWSDDQTTVVFTPTQLLKRGMGYTVVLNGEAQSLGGLSLGIDHQSSWETVPELNISHATPLPGTVKKTYDNITFDLTSYLDEQDLTQYITIEPSVSRVSAGLDANRKTLYVYGDFAPETDYAITLLANLKDAWGDTLDQPYTLNFSTAALDPRLLLPVVGDIYFLTPTESSIHTQATNLIGASLSLGDLPLQDFLRMLGPQGYAVRQSYTPENLHDVLSDFDIPANTSQEVDLWVTPPGTSLSPNLYFFWLNMNNRITYPGPYILAVSNVQLTFKISATDVLVWAVDLRDQTPVSSAPVTIYDESGNAVAVGATDSQGIYQASISPRTDLYNTYTAVLNQPGDELFGVALSYWSLGIGAYEFDIDTTSTPPGLKTYIYTDRPIYRPGQSVFFRLAVRRVENGRYFPADLASIPISLLDGSGSLLKQFDLPLSAFGTAHDEYILVENAQPGYYRLVTENETLSFQVAEYRKPEIDLKVTFTRDQVQQGDRLLAGINARYFFDAPASRLPVHWALYQKSGYFNLQGYQTGPADTGWLDVFRFPYFDTLGKLVQEGDGVTDSEGLLNLNLDSYYPQSEDTPTTGTMQFTLEVTIQDESGFPVSSRGIALAHPADFYIGLRPDTWVGQAGKEIGFDVLTTGWDGLPEGNHTLRADFRKVTWIREDNQLGEMGFYPTYIPEYSTVANVDFATSENGQARLAFTPPEAGTYQLQVSGDGALTQIDQWVGGSGQPIWPNLPNQRLQLTADKTTYLPGETAQVFIPNPFAGEVSALMTIERGIIMRTQIIQLEGAGNTVAVPLTDEDAPNIYVSVTIVGQDEHGATFRQGYTTLNVTPIQQTLNVVLTSQPERTGPGDAVTFNLRVSDANGQPVQGEFSLSVVDKAVLALADPNSADILSAFYGTQPLGVHTSLSLAAHAQRMAVERGGIGGGGELGVPTVRERFPDTAFWEAAIVTDSNGEASVSLNLPDSLTTWQVEVRGLTEDTRVGQTTVQIITTKDLLIRPVVPRFLTAGDHVQLAAIVQNTTSRELTGKINVQSTGVLLDDGQGSRNSLTQNVIVPAGGQVRVEWWGMVENLPSADLLFSVQANGLEDAVRPAGGALPILRYTAPQAYVTAGVLEDASQKLELVNLPVALQASLPDSGELRLELSASLTGALMKSLEVLEQTPYDSTEQTLSRFLPNLETYRLMQSFNLVAPDLQARLDRTLQEGLDAIQARQNADGSWSWWSSGSSDTLVTSYVLFGLARTREAGIVIDPQIITRGIEFLSSNLITPENASENWQLDRLTFSHFALTQVGAGDLRGVIALINVRERLSPWAKALLALSIDSLSPGIQEASLLLSDAQAQAVFSAAGVHWEAGESYRNMNTPISSTAMVVYALAQLDPASANLPNAVRYLMTHRQLNGAWGSTFDTAWTILAATAYMKGTGEFSSDFSYNVYLNGAPLASGESGGDARLTPVLTTVPVTSLYPEDPNGLLIQRDAGPGKLYYTAVLDVNLPVTDAEALSQGFTIQRAYYDHSQTCQRHSCTPIESIRKGQQVVVRLTLVTSSDAYYVIVEDYLPAGAEIVDTSLKTTQLGLLEEQNGYAEDEETSSVPFYEIQDPWEDGWGWWLFSSPLIYDDHITWHVDYLPAGTYELTYLLNTTLVGEYLVLPASVRQYYFPDMQGHTAGTTFSIKP